MLLGHRFTVMLGSPVSGIILLTGLEPESDIPFHRE